MVSVLRLGIPKSPCSFPEGHCISGLPPEINCANYAKCIKSNLRGDSWLKTGFATDFGARPRLCLIFLISELWICLDLVFSVLVFFSQTPCRLLQKITILWIFKARHRRDFWGLGSSPKHALKHAFMRIPSIRKQSKKAKQLILHIFTCIYSDFCVSLFFMFIVPIVHCTINIYLSRWLLWDVMGSFSYNWIISMIRSR